MDADEFDFVSLNEVVEIKAEIREALRQMEDINDKIESVMKKLKRLEEVKKHLKISYDSQFRKIEWGGQYAGRWRRLEVDFNSRLTGTVRGKANRLEDAVDDFVQGPLDPILEGVDREGLKSEIRVLIDLRTRVLDRDPILVFARLLSGWPPQSMTTSHARSVRNNLEEREAQSKGRLFNMLVFLVLFVMGTEGHAGAYRRLVSQLEVEAGANPEKMPLISKFLSLLKEAHRRCGEMMNLRRMTRNILECYSSMTFLDREVSEFLDILVERMEHLDIVLQDIPRRRAGDCIFLQLDWGGEMMIRCEETVQSISEQMWLVYGPCFLEWDSVFASWTRTALAT